MANISLVDLCTHAPEKGRKKTRSSLSAKTNFLRNSSQFILQSEDIKTRSTLSSWKMRCVEPDLRTRAGRCSHSKLRTQQKRGGETSGLRDYDAYGLRGFYLASQFQKEKPSLTPEPSYSLEQENASGTSPFRDRNWIIESSGNC